MLGTDRSSVTAAAGVLQKQKITQYTRGSVRVLNRKALEERSCECYGLIREYKGESLFVERPLFAADGVEASNKRHGGLPPEKDHYLSLSRTTIEICKNVVIGLDVPGRSAG